MSKTALVTGMDTNAIAESICRSLLESGYEVFATSEGKYDEGAEGRVKFDAESAQYSPVVFESVDFAAKDSVASLLSRLSVRTYDVIVNAAAALAMLPNGEDLRNESVDFDYSEFGRVMQCNVTSVAAICLGLKDSIRSGGVIINMTTSAAREGAFATISYNASKAAMHSLTMSLANVLGVARGIRVNSIAPGWIPPSEGAAKAGVVALANSVTPSLVIGKPSDVVAAVRYLIDSPFQNGAVIPVDGGITSSYLPYMLESLQLQGHPIDQVIDSLAEAISEAKSELRRAE